MTTPLPPTSVRPVLEDSLEFINTLEHSRDGDKEHLPTPADLAAWLVEHDALDAPPPVLDEDDLATTRAVRRAMREVADAVVERRPAGSDALEQLNLVLGSVDTPRLVVAASGVAVEHRCRAEPLTDALGHLVEPLVAFIEEGEQERLRVCDNAHCRWVFYDGSRTGRRRWCDMTTCGNRAKAARHRARRRADERTPAA